MECIYIHKPQKPLRISSFFGVAAKGQAEITLGLGLEGCRTCVVRVADSEV